MEVVSRWLDEPVAATTTLDQVSWQFKRECALDDLADIVSADVMVFFSENPECAQVRGGRHVEFGYALACGKPIVVCGPRENIFHYLPDVVVCSTWGAIKDYLRGRCVLDDTDNRHRA